MRFCKICKNNKDENEMVKSGRNRCKKCHSIQQQNWRRTESGKKSVRNTDKNRKQVRFKNKVLSKYPCNFCGESNILVLQFDHIDPKTKIEEIGRMVKRSASIQEIKEEMRKCQILCFNCHIKKSVLERTNI